MSERIKFDEKSIKTWSLIGSRATFGMISLDLAKNIDDLMILTCDVSTSAGLDRFRKSFPEKYLDVGIAEQNLIGIATGLSSTGYKVFTTTFAPFQTMRCCEQIKVNLGYMKKKVNMVGIASGLVLGNLGYTHCCIEDISIIRAIPNIAILSPADCTETVKAVEASLNYKQSVYIRLTGSQNNPIVYKNDYKYEIGKFIELKSGSDITIFSTGTMVYESLEAEKILQTQGISCTVIDVHTIKPIDESAIIKLSKKSKLFVSIEEHSVVGGLGSAIAEVNSTISSSPEHLIIGIPDKYEVSGDYNHIKEKYGLSSNFIAKKILDKFKSL